MQFFLKGQEYLCVLAHRGLRPSPSCPSLIALPGGGGQAHRAAPSLRPLVLMVSAKRSLRLHVGVQEAPALGPMWNSLPSAVFQAALQCAFLLVWALPTLLCQWEEVLVTPSRVALLCSLVCRTPRPGSPVPRSLLASWLT